MTPSTPGGPAGAVSIVIPVFNGISFARACLDSIYRAANLLPFEVIVVDNGSAADVVEWLASERARRRNLTVLRFDRPLGFAKAVNEGVRAARCPLLAILNSDTEVTDGWLDGLAAALDSDPALGAVSPVTNYSGNGPQNDPDTARLRPRDATSYAIRIRTRTEVVPEPDRLVFFCVMVRRQVWERLGGLEEAYLQGNYEDDDFCLRARLAGYRLAVARNVLVFHHPGSPSFRLNALDHDAALTRNQLLFCSRASEWARMREPRLNHERLWLPDVSVIVSVPAGRTDALTDGLEDTLASLSNQTSRGFEVVLTAVESAAAPSVAEVARAYATRLRIVDSADPSPACRYIANLTAGDIFYPCHLEMLSQVLAGSQADAVYGAWSVVDPSGRRGVVRFHGAAPSQLGLDNQPPLGCWMFRRDAISDESFDSSIEPFAELDYILRISRRFNVQYVPRVSYERRISIDSEPRTDRPMQARKLLDRFPSTGPAQNANRVRFLEAVETGRWREFPLLSPGLESEPARNPSPAYSRRAVGIARNIYRAAVPHRVRYGIEWRTRRLLGLPPVLRTDTDELQRAGDALARAILASAQVVRPPGPPDILLFSVIAWDHLVQRPHHFARQFAARGHRVFWVDVKLKPPQDVDSASPARPIEPGLWRVELPCASGQIYSLNWSEPVLAVMETAVAQLRAAYGIRDSIQLVNFPTWAPLALRLRERFGWPVVYDCLDDHKAFSELFRHDAGGFEEELARQADLLIASGRLLLQDRGPLNERALLIPNACDFSLFHSAQPAGKFRDLPRPIVGFFGAISDWLDPDWVEQSAARFPEWSFVYIGRQDFASPIARKRWKSLDSIRNVHVLPPVDPPTLASCLADFDVATMPFRVLPVTRTMNAVKIYEYLAAGKPVLTSEIEELKPLAEAGLIHMYRDNSDSFELLDRLVRSPGTTEEAASRVAFASENTWTKRGEQLETALRTLPQSSDRRIL